MYTEKFKDRHIGVSENDIALMLKKIGINSYDELIDKVIPTNIRLKNSLDLPPAMTEREYAEHISEVIGKNQLFTTYIGKGWYDTITPAPILRNVFENPVWYTSYTPYQAEVSQGRLEALMNFQTMISELTALPLSNCSLLDEATAGAEAATMMFGLRSREQIKNGANVLFVDREVFVQTQAVLNTRTVPQGIRMEVGDYRTFEFTPDVFGAIIQYPNAHGSAEDYRAFVERARAVGAKTAVAADILSLTLLTPPGEWGADIAFGSTQRMGIPMYYGGPAAAYFATRDEYKRNVPGRIIGFSKDAYGKTALRMALQTREQHIKREKATSNICTAQALLATMAGFYAVYHGPEGLKKMASRIHSITVYASEKLKSLGYKQLNEHFFDTLYVQLPGTVQAETVRQLALSKRVNLYYDDFNTIGISFDETTTLDDLNTLLRIFASAAGETIQPAEDIPAESRLNEALIRTTAFMEQEVFNNYHSETELMRYIKKLDRRDISLAQSMISLGSCTMKLNAASELLPLSRPELTGIHPMAPLDQTEGYQYMIKNLCKYLSEITGMADTSLQPNSGAAGEYAGLRCIRSYQESIGQGHRHIVLIPASAHGTNPASAIQAGYDVVVVRSDENGNVDVNDMRAKAEENSANLAACMITYPSTHGIFETSIVEICDIIHQHGGQLYMDGANMNAQVGLTNPGSIGADVCHLNLHKTFAIPHGGGGPGVGPICVKEHLVPFLPHHPLLDGNTLDTVSGAPFGSAGVIAVTYGYIRMMGADGLTEATRAAILNANYLATCLSDTYGIVYRGANGYVGHELILECRNIKTETGITETDIAKRLMDYGFHAPTLSFPVAGTLMVEPTESESLSELNRFVQTMDSIYNEIQEVKNGIADAADNVLINSPHPQYEVTADEWKHSYPRSKAAFPLEWIQDNKFWINVARVDNALGDRNLVSCICELSLQ